MPKWAGTWKGGRYYLTREGKPVYFIERRGRSVKLQTHDEDLATGQLAAFLADPEAFCRPPPVVAGPLAPVDMSTQRINLYMASIRKACKDHYNARKSYLVKWSEKGLDLRTVDRNRLREVLADFGGGFRGRAEALNAFARFLVKEGDLPVWNPLVCTLDPEATRAPREAYSLEQLRACFARLTSQTTKDLFYLRATTGLHHTEIRQLQKCKLYDGPLPEKGTGIRTLGGDHAIQGVLQVMHKSKRRHRQSVDAAGLRVALRLWERVPSRGKVWAALDPLVPSNLRHTFDTLAGEVGELLTYTGGGVDRARIAQVMGHRAGSTMGPDRYERIQIPPMVRLPIDLDVL